MRLHIIDGDIESDGRSPSLSLFLRPAAQQVAPAAQRGRGRGVYDSAQPRPRVKQRGDLVCFWLILVPFLRLLLFSGNIIIWVIIIAFEFSYFLKSKSFRTKKFLHF